MGDGGACWEEQGCKSIAVLCVCPLDSERSSVGIRRITAMPAKVLLWAHQKRLLGYLAHFVWLRYPYRRIAGR